MIISQLEPGPPVIKLWRRGVDFLPRQSLDPLVFDLRRFEFIRLREAIIIYILLQTLIACVSIKYMMQFSVYSDVESVNNTKCTKGWQCGLNLQCTVCLKYVHFMSMNANEIIWLF